MSPLARDIVIVLVATASAHRREALDACAFLIDWLKTKAPFWKLEETPEGERWVEARANDDAADDADVLDDAESRQLESGSHRAEMN
jgi:molybdopterin synthase catalytic subunit